MAGYSGTPLAQKLGIRTGMRIFVSGSPQDYLKLVGRLPDDAAVVPRLTPTTNIAHIFCKKKAQLSASLGALRSRLRDDGAIWVSWPKKSANVPTDITEDVIRSLAIPLGLVDVKVCAVDDVWSGLKLVIRKEHRTGSRQAR